MSASSTALPPQQATLFKRLVKCYEQKQHKQALKHCKAILSHPGLANHGETLSMKALVVNALGRKTEAYELARLGLRNDLKSHVCWHVFGLIYRSDKNYAEAIKCYRNALKFDKDNLQILRDLSLLQVQMRDLEGYAHTRNLILQQRPSQRASWLCYAVANHLQGNIDQALNVLSAYETAYGGSSSNENIEEYEAAELVMYKAQLHVEKGDYDGALECLAKGKAKLVDDVAVQEMQASVLLKQNKLSEAEALYRALLHRNPEDRLYFEGLQKALGFNESTPQESLLELYEKLQEEYPLSQMARRLPLALSSGPQFEALIDAYLRKGLRKGITPLFRLIRDLYKSPEKTAVIDKLLRGYLSCLRSTGKLDAQASSPVETPATLLWTFFITAQHLDLHGHGQEALQLIDEAITHTPTLIDLYMVKAKILKHGGNPQEAAKVMDSARELDTADRYINSKAVKYCLRANDVAHAEELAAMFTRQEKSTDPIGQLTEMQCIWFETEEALAFIRTGAVGKALKKLHAINEHFVQITDDQFDFHSYCFRKATLRAYVRLLRLEDQLYGHKFYVRAALIAIETYIGLHDVPFTLASANKTDASLDHLPESERKKILNKQRKAAKRAEAQAAPAPTAAAPASKPQEDGKGEEKKVDTDPEGLQLAQTATPLEEALKFLRPLKTLAANNIEVQFASFEIYWRKQKPLLMLQALKRTAAIDNNHPRLHNQRVRFLHKYCPQLSSLNAKVAEVIKGELPALFGGSMDPSAFNAQFLKANKSSFAHVLSVAEMMVHLDPAATTAAAALFENPSGDLQTLSRALYVLVKTLKASDEAVARFRSRCRALFPLAAAFAEDDRAAGLLAPLAKTSL